MYWLQRYPLIVFRLTLGCSLLSAWALAGAGPYGDLQQKLRHAHSDADVLRIVKDSPQIASQSDFKDAIRLLKDGDSDTKTVGQSLRTMVDLGAMAEKGEGGVKTDQSDAKAIKSSPLYQDPGIDQKRNWLADALRRLKKLKFKQKEPDRAASGFGFFGPWLSYVMWGFLAAAVGVLLYVAAMHVKWQNSLSRKAKALLEEDEPDLTLDEWLQLADKHASEGRFREAVRALYLACLLKFDENDVARFQRGETNWEHLARIEVSPNLPAGLDFRTPTQRFDRIWYGYRTDGIADVTLFRDWYQEITASLKVVKA